MRADLSPPSVIAGFLSLFCPMPSQYIPLTTVFPTVGLANLASTVNLIVIHSRFLLIFHVGILRLGVASFSLPLHPIFRTLAELHPWHPLPCHRVRGVVRARLGIQGPRFGRADSCPSPSVGRSVGFGFLVAGARACGCVCVWRRTFTTPRATRCSQTCPSC
jgi:hypothetical protein